MLPSGGRVAEGALQASRPGGKNSGGKKSVTEDYSEEKRGVGTAEHDPRSCNGNVTLSDAEV